VLDVLPGDGSNLQVLGYFVDGVIYLPGSLTKEEFEEDPYQAAQREIDRGTKRQTTKGRLGLRFNTKFGENDNQELEITGYGTIKYFHRTAADYRIMNRYGLGNSFRYINRHTLASLDNEFSVGGDMLYQAGPIESYQNISGNKGDVLLTLTDETIGNTGFYFSDFIELYNKQLYLLLTGRYDNVYFETVDQLLGARSTSRRFEAFTPKAAINYKLTPYLAVYTSYGLSFDSPAGNEMANFQTSSQPNVLLNPDLNAQKSKNFELGIKGHIINQYAEMFKSIVFEATVFNIIIDDEIVPFEVFGEVYYRNSAVTNRRGLEVGANVELITGLTFQGSYTYSDFKYDTYEALSVDQNLDTVSQKYDGNIVPTVPEHNFFAALSYAHSFTDDITGFIRGSYRYISGMYVDDANTDKTDGYGLLNAGIGADLLFGRFNLLLNAGVNNIADKVYVGFININSSNGRYYEAGEPFNYYCGINLGYAFN
jgi:iron complex outermembrane receptor protein